MSLLQMSFSGGVIILLTVIIRALAIHRLPKRVFLLLWGIALVRLLVPYSLPSVFSFYTLLEKARPVAEIPMSSVVFEGDFTLYEVETEAFESTAAAVSEPLAKAFWEKFISGTMAVGQFPLNPWTVVWLAGMSACALFFAIAYLKCRKEFQESLPVENEFTRDWLNGHLLRRKIEIRSSDRISTPLTYGVLHPVILMPKRIDWRDCDGLKFVFSHEYVHIRRLDAVTKLVLTVALCIHWFNPAVWILYFLMNRDIELSCDEAIVRQFGERTKVSYAMTLIRMEEARSGLVPLCNNFSKNAIEERIEAIMKMKKTSVMAWFVAAILVVGVTLGFATSGWTAAAKSADVAVKTASEDAVCYSWEDGETRYSGASGYGQQVSSVEWWTAEEYAEWLEQEKAKLSKPTADGDMLMQFGYDSEAVQITTDTVEGIAESIGDGISRSINEYAVFEGTGPFTGEKMFSTEDLTKYEVFGLVYDEEKRAFFWKGKQVRYFADEYDVDGNIAIIWSYCNEDGEVDIHSVRQAVRNADGSMDPGGELIGIEEYKPGEVDFERLFSNDGRGGCLVADQEYVVAWGNKSDESMGCVIGQGAIAWSDGISDAERDILKVIARFEAYGVTYVKGKNFGNLYYNGEPVEILIDRSPDGSYTSFRSDEGGKIKLQAVYGTVSNQKAELIGVEIVE